MCDVSSPCEGQLLMRDKRAKTVSQEGGQGKARMGRNRVGREEEQGCLSLHSIHPREGSLGRLKRTKRGYNAGRGERPAMGNSYWSSFLSAGK